MNGLTGDLQADTGGGPFSGESVAAAKASVITEGGAVGLTLSTAPAYVFVGTGGGPATLTFDGAPTTVTVNTEGGSATLNVPGGPYSVAADSDGGSQTVDVLTAAGRAPLARRQHRRRPARDRAALGREPETASDLDARARRRPRDEVVGAELTPAAAFERDDEQLPCAAWHGECEAETLATESGRSRCSPTLS